MKSSELLVFQYVPNAIRYCNSRGYSITRPGLYYVIKRHPSIFKRTTVGTYYPRIYVDELDEYIEMVCESPPDGYIKVSEAVKMYGISMNTIYYLIRNKKLKTKRIGRGMGILYVDRKDIEKYGRNNKKFNRKN